METFDERYFATRRIASHQDIFGRLQYFIAYLMRIGYYRSWLRLMRKYVKCRRILDLGCGLGYFLATVKRQYDCVGSDISPTATANCKSTDPSVEVICATSEAPGLRERAFDAVTCFDVLEHLASPGSTIRRIHDLLKDQGVLLISTPNLNAVGLRILKHRWHGYLDDTHISMLPRHNWIKLIKQNGFEIRRIFSDGLIFVILREQHKSQKSKRLVRCLPYYLIGQLSLIAFCFGLRMPAFGENLCILAQKVPL